MGIFSGWRSRSENNSPGIALPADTDADPAEFDWPAQIRPGHPLPSLLQRWAGPREFGEPQTPTGQPHTELEGHPLPRPGRTKPVLTVPEDDPLTSHRSRNRPVQAATGGAARARPERGIRQATRAERRPISDAKTPIEQGGIDPAPHFAPAPAVQTARLPTQAADPREGRAGAGRRGGDRGPEGQDRVVRGDGYRRPYRTAPTDDIRVSLLRAAGAAADAPPAEDARPRPTGAPSSRAGRHARQEADDTERTVVLHHPDRMPLPTEGQRSGRAPRAKQPRGRHAKPAGGRAHDVARDSTTFALGDIHSSELANLTGTEIGWHHQQFEESSDGSRPRARHRPRHAAPRQEQPVKHVEDVEQADVPTTQARKPPMPTQVGDPHAALRERAEDLVASHQASPVVSRETPGTLDTPIASMTKAALEALTGRAPEMPRPARPRTLVVANQKGGVGKTTTTVNLAAALAMHGCRVLVIDLDPQGNASTALGVDHFAGVPSIYEVIIEGKPLADIIRPADGIEGLFCAPATIDLAGAEIELVSLVARESRLGRALGAFDEYFDYIFIDCPPSLGLLTVNALVAAEEVLIPIQCEYYALEGLGQLLRNVDLVKAHLNQRLHVSTILLTMYDARTRLASQVASEVRQHFEQVVLATTIPRSVRISEAPSYGQTVITYDPASSGALSYVDAAREIAIRGAGTVARDDQRSSGDTRSNSGETQGISGETL